MPGKRAETSKQKAGSKLGSSLIRASKKEKRNRKFVGTGFHTADIASSNHPLQSITELNSLEEFVSSAVLAEREFIAERGAMTFVSSESAKGAADAAIQMRRLRDGIADLSLQEAASGALKYLRIPRRPKWTLETKAEELQHTEKEAFLAWRRAIAAQELEHGGGVALGSAPVAAVTPFEKNLEVWRQLWRVVEKSDVLVQIVDGRNPLLYHCPDLDSYVAEVNKEKRVLLVVNKADYLTSLQRYAWATHLTAKGMDFVFFSAKREIRRMEEADRLMQTMLPSLATDIDEAYMAGNDPGVNNRGREDIAESLARATAEAEERRQPTRTHEDGILSAKIRESDVGKPGLTSLAATFRKALIEDDSDSESESGDEGAAAAAASESGSEGEGASGPAPVGGAGVSADHTSDSDGEGDDDEGDDEFDSEGGDGAVKAPILGDEEMERITADLSGIDPSDPLYSKCKVLDREEFIAVLAERYKDVPRGILGGPAEEVARRKLEEMRSKRKAEALAARTEELRRRQIIAARLIEAGLGSQVRFGDERDLTSLEQADEEEYDSDEDVVDQPLVIGMVGYPNVGKSSTINALMGATAQNHAAKRVAVASTPGKTKHFQTLILNDDITLCDCPGLVFPSFVSTREEMVVNGVLPIDQLKEHTGPMRLLCQRIPRPILESAYGLTLPVPPPPQNRNRQPTIIELLDTYCRARGFMAAAHSGTDHPRGARILLKDYCEGRLLYCHPPPGGWDAYLPDETAHVDTGVTEVPAELLVPGSTKGVAHAGSSKSSRFDNVLLPKAANRHSAPAPKDISSLVRTPLVASTAVASASGTAAAAVEAGGDDDASSEGSLVEEGEVALDNDALRSFSRKIAVEVVVEEEEGSEGSSGEEEEEAEENNTGAGAGAGEGGEGSKTFTVARIPKKERGLLKNRRLRKGEAHEVDPYGTSKAADAAVRLYHLAEIAAVTSGPIMSGDIPLAAPPAPGKPITHGRQVTKPDREAHSKPRTQVSGATIRGVVPAHVTTRAV